MNKGEAGLARKSMVKLAQILTIDRARLRRRVGTLPRDRLAEVDEAIRVSLDVG